VLTRLDPARVLSEADRSAGVTLQVYCALIASVLPVLWTGCKLTKRQWEMLQLYWMGWADLDELERASAKRKKAQDGIRDLSRPKILREAVLKLPAPRPSPPRSCIKTGRASAFFVPFGLPAATLPNTTGI